MTLVITVATERCIYQSADFRLTDIQTGAARDFETQKMVFVNTFSWAASIGFAGVGRTANVDVSDWLQKAVGAVGGNDPFEALLEVLLSADSWLSGLHPPNNRHSFTVGAFVGCQPLVALISNFESLSGEARTAAARNLSVEQVEPSRPTTFVSGHREALAKEDRRTLAKFAARGPSRDAMYAALSQANRRAARRSRYVSSACFTSHLRSTGDGGGASHGTGNARLKPSVAMPMPDVVKDLLDKQFGVGQWTPKSFSVARSEATDDWHRTQLKEKAHDPDCYSNFGAYLADLKKDQLGAERAYRRALELAPGHINALGNLGNLLAVKGALEEAEACYVAALSKPGPGHENAVWNYASFLITHRGDRQAAREALNKGVAVNPESARLWVRIADEAIRAGCIDEALQAVCVARERNAEQKDVEACFAMALQLSGASPLECIAAYRTAISLNPDEANLKLNLAQLLFIQQEEGQARSMLQVALRGTLDPSARLESQVYLLCHCGVPPGDVAKATLALLAEGGRLSWDVQANIRLVRAQDERRALLVSRFVKCMESGDGRDLDEAVDDYQRAVGVPS